MSDEPRYKLVDGVMVELTPEEIEQIERDEAAEAERHPQPEPK